MKHTKADYERVAQQMAFSLATQLRTTEMVEFWLESMRGLERQLLVDAWGRLQAQRKRFGDCVDCGGGSQHYPGCPQYQRPER